MDQEPTAEALVLRGARRVGKPTLVRQFAAAQGLVLNEANLEGHLSLDQAFASLNIDVICAGLLALLWRRRSGTHSL